MGEGAAPEVDALPGYYRPKRSFGQGNIFTSVCHSFCSRGGGLSGPGGVVWSRGGLSGPGGVFFWGGSSKFSGRGVPPNFGGGVFLGGPPNFGGVSFWGVPPNFGGGVSFGGSFGGVPPYFRGGVPPNFLGGVSFLGGGSPPEYGQRSAGTHPTGTHSCLFAKNCVKMKEFRPGGRKVVARP